MTEAASEEHGAHPPEAIDRRRLILNLAAMPPFFAVFMFLPAGTWRWPKGWLLILAIVVSGSFASLYIWRVNPELMAARINPHQGTKHWDKILLRFLAAAMIAVFVVAALDDGRFHWFPLSWRVCLFGYGLVLAGVVLTTWAEGVNKFFEPTVRLQTDRGQTVVDAGPYAIIRHPGYVGGSLIFLGFALCLGSLWALIPAVLSCMLFILRTCWEDQTLQAELSGYNEYAARVPYKWIPGVW